MLNIFDLKLTAAGYIFSPLYFRMCETTLPNKSIDLYMKAADLCEVCINRIPGTLLINSKGAHTSCLLALYIDGHLSETVKEAHVCRKMQKSFAHHGKI